MHRVLNAIRRWPLPVLQSAGNLPVQLQNPDGTLSNPLTFVVLAPGTGAATIPLTPSAPTSERGNDIVVVELSTNGGSGAAGNVSLNVAAIGAYTFVRRRRPACLPGAPVIRSAARDGDCNGGPLRILRERPRSVFHPTRSADRLTPDISMSSIASLWDWGSCT